MTCQFKSHAYVSDAKLSYAALLSRRRDAPDIRCFVALNILFFIRVLCEFRNMSVVWTVNVFFYTVLSAVFSVIPFLINKCGDLQLFRNVLVSV